MKAKLLAKKDGGLDAYYRDVRVWLSEIQYGCMVLHPCPYCCMNKHVVKYCWPTNHVAWSYVGLKTTKHLMGRQYKACMRRESKCHDAAIEAAKASQCKIVSAYLCQFILMTVVLKGLYPKKGSKMMI